MKDVEKKLASVLMVFFAMLFFRQGNTATAIAILVLGSCFIEMFTSEVLE